MSDTQTQTQSPPAPAPESKPSGAGTHYGQLSAGGQWFWDGTGLPGDEWIPASQQRPAQMAAQRPTAPVLGGKDAEITDPRPSERDQQAMLDLMASCPHSWQGDYGFYLWCQQVFAAGADSAPQTPAAPVISAISPTEVQAGTTGFRIGIAGTGLGEGAVVTVAAQDQATTVGARASVDPSAITAPGSVAVAVRNADGALSNTIDLTVS